MTIPTYRRPDLLRALIPAVTKAIEVSGHGGARLVVVDNDPDRSAERVARDLGVEYAHQPVPGIAATRQMALDVAGPRALVAMIDDDVEPEAGWLSGLLDAWARTHAAVVVGFVQYEWPPEASAWIAAGGFMRRERHTATASLNSLSTGNVLIDAAQIAEMRIGFDLTLGTSGGEDAIFGQDVLARGGRIVAADSTVRDRIPPSRATREFVRDRTIGQGKTRVRVELHGATSPIGRLLRRAEQFFGGLLRLAVFTAIRLWGGWTRDVTRDAVAQRRAWFAVGRILGSVGMVSREYARGADPPPS